MPSGPKKRKAAKRKKEQEQRQQLGAHHPDSPTSPATGPPHHPQGNGEREEEDDLISQEGKGSDSGSDFASPTARDNHRHRLEFEADEEQAQARVEAKGEEKMDEKESDTIPSVDAVNMMASTKNGGNEHPSRSLEPQKTEDEVTKKSEVEVPVVAVEVKRDDAPLPPPSDPVPPVSVEVPISELEEVSGERIQSEKGKDVAAPGDLPPSIEPKQSDAVDTASPVKLSVPISEHVQTSDVPPDSLKVAESATEVESNKNEGKVIPLTDDSREQPDVSMESHPHTESRQITRTTEVTRPTRLEQRASWMNCCGLLDLFAGDNR